MKKHRIRLLGIVIALVIGITAGLNYIRPLPTAAANTASLSSQLGAPTIAWPTAGEAAVGAVGYGLLSASASQTPLSTASIAKIITALAVLKVKPLSIGEQGPIITISPSDVAIYNQYVAEDGSVVAVTAGEQITEYQALQAMMLPSANNIADSLAIWAFGSLSAYQTYATQLVSQLGLTDTVIGSDASGYSPDTTSTAADLVHLGEAAIQNPVIASIVKQNSASLPIVGTVYNVDTILGEDGIIGVKTGNNDQDTGAFLFAAIHTLSNGQSVTIVGAVMGQGSLNGAFSSTTQVLDSAAAAFAVETPVTTDQTLITYTAPWSKKSFTAAAKTSLSIAAWQGTVTMPHITTSTVTGSLPSGAKVGTVSVSAGANNVSSPIVLTSAIPKPTFWWRLTRL